MTATTGQPPSGPVPPLLSVRGLKTYFPVHGGLFSTVQGHIHAVDDVSFDVRQGETLGLVGESGCGKSTLSQTIMRIVPATGGSVQIGGADIFSLSKRQLRAMRGDVQLIFQDPFSSLDPRMPVGRIIEEPLLVHGVRDKAERRARAVETMGLVGLEASYFDRYPHEFSGGQRQRVSIARSLVLRPKLILCDEPVSALDVSIQSQILNLLHSIQKQLDLTYVFISHALNVVRHVSDRVAVMYLGRIVEIADSEDIFIAPRHPYTKALLSAIPVPDPDVVRERILLRGDLPSPKNPPAGCRFHTRCNLARARCKAESPLLQEVSPGHQVACFLE